MMRTKVGLLLFTLLLSGSMLTAQVKTPADHLMIQFGYHNWYKKPDSIKTTSLGYFFNAFLCYDFKIKKTKLSFGTGIGVGTQVVFLNNQFIRRNDTGILSTAAHFYDDTDNEYKRYKFNTVFLTAPFELRYYANTTNRDKGFKAAIGVQVGALLGAHTKGLKSAGGTNLKEKENGKRFISPWNFAATARVGYGHFSLFGSYNFTNVFRETNGPDVAPISIGLSLSGL
jgi:hypothetical protein